MARSTGPVIIAGAIAAGNEALFTPLAHNGPADWAPVWRLIPVTAGLAVALALLEKAAPDFAVGLAWLLVAGVVLFPPGNAPSIITNLNTIGKF